MHLLPMYILFSYRKVKGRLLIPTSRFPQCLCILFHLRGAAASSSISMVPLHPVPSFMLPLYPALFSWCLFILFPFPWCLCILFHFYHSSISYSHFHGASVSCSISMVPLHPLSFTRCLCILFPLLCCLCKLHLFPWCFCILFPFLWCCSPSSFSLLSTNGRETTRDSIPIKASWHIFPFHLSFLMYASRCNCKEQSLKRDRVGRINKTDDKNQRTDLLYTMIAVRKFSRLRNGYKHS